MTSSTIHIEEFLRANYSDRALVDLRAAAMQGKLSALSLTHCLLGMSDKGYVFHRRGLKLFQTPPAETEFIELVSCPWFKRGRRRLSDAMLPLINAEIERRAIKIITTGGHDEETTQFYPVLASERSSR